MKKILLFIVVTFILAGNSVIVFSNQIDVDEYITYDVVNIEFLTTDKSYEPIVIITDTENVTMNDNYKFIAQMKSSKNGFSVTAQLPVGTNSNTYYVIVTDGNGNVYTKKFWYINDQQAAMLLAKLTNTEKNEFANVIRLYAEDLAINITEFNRLQDAITDIFYQFKGNSNITKEIFMETFNDAMTLADLKGKTEVSEIQNIVGEKVEKTIGSSFEFLSAEIKNEIFQRFSKGIYTANSFKNQVKEWLVIAEVNNIKADNIQNYENMLLNKYDAITGFSANYKYYSSDKSKVLLALVNGKPFDSLAILKDTFNDAVNNNQIESKDGKITTPSGGGGGFSASGGAVVSEAVYDPITIDSGIFDDVPKNHWAYEALLSLYDMKIVLGKDKKIFDPDSNVTRGEFAKIISEALFINAEAGENIFSDVDPEAWYSNYAFKLGKFGILKGDDNRRFNADIPITRQDASLIIYRSLMAKKVELKMVRTYAGFVDEGSIDDYALEAVRELFKAQIINGMGDNRFSPKENISRIQSVALVYNCLNVK